MEKQMAMEEIHMEWEWRGPEQWDKKGGARQGGIFVWQTPRVCCFMLPSPCFFVKRLRIVVVGWSPMATDACGWTAGSGQQTVNIDARVAQAGGDPVSSMLCILLLHQILANIKL
ncbi:uncharacterized protein B0T23DRAFT_327213 [Neurospora hispaniola]|uniref:Uncharacterized protein n=1 Tax=Neurospora hispaniola TaxID=588809 RepID=A0AAJ0HYM6_9PEZI|nr:hypothetical protein B0T23DRAFT_327213 [Neurospora hispaniola]